MKGKQRIKLLKSQKILLQTKKQEALNLIQAKRNELNQILSIIMAEQGVPEKETDLWYLTEDGQAIEKIEPKKPDKGKGDKKSDGKNKDKKKEK